MANVYNFSIMTWDLLCPPGMLDARECWKASNQKMCLTSGRHVLQSLHLDKCSVLWELETETLLSHNMGFFFKINTKFGFSHIFSYTRENDLPHQILYFPKYSYNCTGAMIFVSSVLRYEKYVLWLCHLCTSFYYFYSYINLLLYTYSHFHIIYSNAL